MTNHTDLRIQKLLDKGLTMEQVARKIGRPGDIRRIQEARIRNRLMIRKR
jgi:hypothetical protein